MTSGYPLPRAATSAVATPARVDSESLLVSGTTFSCDVYEATSEGKTYRLWLSTKMPAAVKVTVDGIVARELAEIKR